MTPMRQYRRLALAACILVLAFTEVLAQETGGVYLDSTRSSRKYRKILYLNANQVESIIENKGTFGQINNRDYSGAWPRGSGHGHIQEMTLMVSAKVFSPTGQELHISSESFDDSPDRAPNGTEYFWNPLPNYANENRRAVNKLTGAVSYEEQIANSMDTTTYPPSWPGKDETWNKHWNGYFGKDQFNADQEVVYVIDDSYNSEFPYYPRAADTTWRGLGLQVETRMFQWAHPLAEDQVFIHFQVSNISDNDYDRNIFLGAFADTHPGGLDDADDNSGYDKAENMVFAWDNDNGTEHWLNRKDILPGYLAWKYLESPGFPNDGIDNDNDGLLDEKRDNDAGTWIFGPIGKYGDPKWHWSGDEDGDWVAETDDVGSDGIGPTDPNYVAPDRDGTEGNGRPDQGEPNFGKTDKDESDQIGLTSFYSPAYGSVHSSDDEQIWNYIQPGIFETPAQNSNNMWVFASGPFQLSRSKSERFSVCWLFGEDRQEIYRNAHTSQQIYNNNYRFTKAPIAPVLTAIPGNRRVILYWNDFAERSVDPLYGQDFEGYRIYRGTNAELSEAQTISDAFGNAAYMKPIAQFDLKDGIKGLHPVALGAELGDQYSKGIHFYMGDDSGLKHYFVDSNDVVNGVKYYYVIRAYDKGYYTGMDNRNLVPTSPSESAYRLQETYGTLESASSATAVVVPNAPAVNYKPGSLRSAVMHGGTGNASGRVSVDVVDPDKLPNGHVFEVTFETTAGADTGIGVPVATTYSLRDTSSGEMIIAHQAIPLQYVAPDSNLGAVTKLPWQQLDTVWTTKVADGMAVNFLNHPPSLLDIRSNSGWEPGSAGTAAVSIDYDTPTNPVAYPFSFDIEFTSQTSGLSLTNKGSTTTFNTYFKVTDAVTKQPLKYYLKETLFSKNGKWDKSERLSVAAPTPDGRLVWAYALDLVTFAETILPQPGDVYHFRCPVPFTTSDKYYFSTSASSLEQPAGQGPLDRVAVVPNPYLLSAAWERASVTTGRGERKICFIHLPAECTIRIFTQNGVLLKTMRHAGSMADGTANWDLTTDEGLEVAFGIYVYHIEAPGTSAKIGTFAIIN